MLKNEILQVAIYSGEIMLKSGAETYRVEDIIERMCRSKGLDDVNSFVTPTGMFVSDNKTHEATAIIKRVKNRKIDLDKISQVNNFARSFISGDMPYEDAIERLNRIDNTPKFHPVITLLLTGLASAFFTLLFGGMFPDFIAAFFISMISIGVFWSIDRLSDTQFLSTTASSVVISICSILSYKMGLGTSFDMIIVGAVMPLVPGVALTNGIRDLISGDILSGIARVFEAVMIAVSIAVGVGSVLGFWTGIMGGSLI